MKKSAWIAHIISQFEISDPDAEILLGLYWNQAKEWEKNFLRGQCHSYLGANLVGSTVALAGYHNHSVILGATLFGSYFGKKFFQHNDSGDETFLNSQLMNDLQIALKNNRQQPVFILRKKVDELAVKIDEQQRKNFTREKIYSALVAIAIYTLLQTVASKKLSITPLFKCVQIFVAATSATMTSLLLKASHSEADDIKKTSRF